MATVADVLAAAQAVMDDGTIYRTPADWSGYVSIQQSPPYPPGRFGTQHVEHCGISVAHVFHRAGLTQEQYPYEVMQYAPALAQHANSDVPRVGCAGTINWQPGDGEPDHVVLIVGGDDVDEQGCVRGSRVRTWEANTTPDGTPAYYWRDVGLFEGFIMPDYDGTPTTTTAATSAPHPAAARPIEGETMILKVPLPDKPGHNMFYLIGGRLSWAGADDIMQIDGAPVVWFTDEAAFQAWYRWYCDQQGLNPLTGKPL